MERNALKRLNIRTEIMIIVTKEILLQEKNPSLKPKLTQLLILAVVSVY